MAEKLMNLTICWNTKVKTVIYQVEKEVFSNVLINLQKKLYQRNILVHNI